MSLEKNIPLLNYSDAQNFDFQKAMQQNVQKIIQPILYENQFCKYGKNKYARETDKLIQIITFSVGKYRLRAFAMYFPIFLPYDNFLSYGIEITGSSGIHLLNGKYFPIIYEKEKFNKEIQLQHYKKEHIANFYKLVYSIKKGILPEMNTINSFDKFMKKFESQEVYFFENKMWNILKHPFHKSIVSIYHFLNGEQLEKCISELEALKNTSDTLDPNFANYIEKFLYLSKNEEVLTETKLLSNIDNICDERRKKYKLLKKSRR